MTLTIFPDRVENPANLARIRDAARLVHASCSDSVQGRLIALENAPRASPIYGRRPLEGHATIAVGHERRGLSERTLAMAAETLVIPTQSRSVTTLNVAAAAAVAAWYVLRGSAPQAHVARPDARRPSMLLVGYDHVEVGSSLRSAAAFGFRDVLLDDRGAGWFEGSPALRREARAAARRHKNPLLVHRGGGPDIERFDEVVFVIGSGPATPFEQTRVARGRNQLVVVGLEPNELREVAPGQARVATLGLEPFERPPLRLTASIVLAEIARQVGRRRRIPGRPAVRPPRYEAALRLASMEDVLWIDPSRLLEY